MRAIHGPMREAICEAVRMRKTGGTECSMAEFFRFLRNTGIKVPGQKAPLRFKASYSCLRAYILEVLNYSWPRTTGATGIQVKE